jgi:hypothetical protein
VELTVERSPEPSAGAVRMQVRVRDGEFQPMDDAMVVLEVTPVGLTTSNASPGSLRLRPEPVSSEPGLFASTYVPRATGGYRVNAYVTNSLGAEIGRPETGWATDLAADEFRVLEPNVALLEEIARRTGGALVRAGELAAFARRAPQQAAPVMEAWITPAWHTPWLFLLALACFVSEWGIRRWKGLP